MVDPPAPKASLPPSNEPVPTDRTDLVAPRAAAITASDKKSLRAILLAKQASIDKFVTRVHRVIQSREGLDITLLFVAEAARLLGAILDIFSKVASHKSARFLVTLISRLPKSVQTLLFLTRSVPFSSFAGEASNRLQTLVIILEEWQILSRLWGVFDMWMSTKEFLEENSDGDGKSQPARRVDTVLAVMQRVSLTSFHLCEAVALLSSKEVLRWSPDTQDKLFGWAARSWGAFISVELSRLLVEWFRKRQSGEDSDYAEWKQQWRKEFTQNLAWAPLTVHWSRLPEGLLPEILVALFGLYPAMGYMKDIWEGTA